MSVLNLIASNNFIVLNKTLISLLGIDEALILGELASEYDYWLGQGKVDDGWFFSTVENIERNTTLSKYKQKKALENLQQKGLISLKIKGIPAKRYVKINEEAISQIFDFKKSKNLTSRSKEILLLEDEKFDRNNNKENKNKTNKNKKEKEIYKEKEKERDKSNDHFLQNDRVTSKAIKEKKSENSFKAEGNKKTPRVTEEQLREEFKEVWDLYPRKQGRKVAYAAFVRARKKNTPLKEIREGIKQYAKYIKDKKISQEFIKQGSTFFNQNAWEDEWNTEETRNSYQGISFLDYEEMTAEEQKERDREELRQFLLDD